MGVHFHVLASGSSGNCSLLDLDGFGVLIDLGLGPRQVIVRFRAEPPLWDRVRAALLTHVHGDHWNENTFRHLGKRGVIVHCHSEHAARLNEWSPAFATLARAGLVSCYQADTTILLGPGCRALPVPLRHDGGLTFGFRFEGPPDVFGACWALAYATDLGTWDGPLVGRFTDVDVLALEFNHDVVMQHQCGRPPALIRRVLGDHGHLSNVQAADLFMEVLRRSEPGRLRHLVQLHLSRQCNDPALAIEAAQRVLLQAAREVKVHTTSQDDAGPSVALDGILPRTRFRRARVVKRRAQASSLFADWD
jgi:hypothetical protein